MDIAGWDHRYVRMPQGANEDVRHVVSQGVPTIWQEDVGEYRDRSLANYTQDKSVYTEYVHNGLMTDDYDDSPGRWDISYGGNGQREWVVTDGHGGTPQRIPFWNYSTSDEAVNDLLGRYVWAPTGYAPMTANLLYTTQLAARGPYPVGYDSRDHYSDWIASAPYGWHEWYVYDWERFNRDWETIESTDETEKQRHNGYGWYGGSFTKLAGWYEWEEYRDRTRSWVAEEIDETYNDYQYDWTSIWTDIYDKRLTANYRFVTHEQAIYGNRPRYEAYDQNTRVVRDNSINRWVAEPIVEGQTTLVTSRRPDDQLVAFGGFTGEALHAGGAVQVDLGGNASVGGLVTALAGSVSIDAAGNLAIQGRAARGPQSRPTRWRPKPWCCRPWKSCSPPAAASPWATRPNWRRRRPGRHARPRAVQGRHDA